MRRECSSTTVWGKASVFVCAVQRKVPIVLLLSWEGVCGIHVVSVYQLDITRNGDVPHS